MTGEIQKGYAPARSVEDHTVHPTVLRSGRRELRIFVHPRATAGVPNDIAQFRSIARVIFIYVPLALSFIYLFFVASDRYMSEARFLVRSTSANAISEFSSIVQPQSLSRATDETYVVRDYLLSRGAMSNLVKYDSLLQILNRPEADFINRYPPLFGRRDDLALLDRYREMVDVNVDANTGIVALRVFAFRSEDATNVALALIADAEDFLNRMNRRAEQDEVAYAQSFVDEAREKVARIEQSLSEFRNENGSSDPNEEASQALDMIASLKSKATEMRADLEQQAATTPSSPALAARRQQIASLEAQILLETHKLVGKSGSLVSKLGGFERLVIEREIAARSFAAAMSNLDRTRQESAQKHLYIQQIVSPSHPDRAEYPKRALDMLIVFLIGGGLYIVVMQVYSAIVEHRP